MGILDGIVKWIAEQVMHVLDMITSTVLGALGCDMKSFLRYFPAAETMYQVFWALGILADLKKTHSTKKPDENIPGYFFLAAVLHFFLHLCPAKVGHGKSFYLKMQLYQLQQRKRGRKDIEPKR